MTSGRIDFLERGDSFAPATACVTWTGFVNVSSNNSVTLAVTGLSEVTGNVFEYVPSAQALRIKQAGVIGFLVNISWSAYNIGNLVLQMRQASPLHEWLLLSHPYSTHYNIDLGTGGVRLVNVPSGGANYQIYVTNSGGIGNFTLNVITIRLVYLGRR